MKTMATEKITAAQAGELVEMPVGVETLVLQPSPALAAEAEPRE